MTKHLKAVIDKIGNVHRRFGGRRSPCFVQCHSLAGENSPKLWSVVPKLASREHLRNIGYVIRKAFSDAGKTQNDIDGIAVTQGPGLIGSLLVGVSFAKAMAFSLKKPLVPVNHIEGHIYSAFIEHPRIDFPVLALVVSGGHTSLIYSPEPGKYQSIGRARDDAAGEALDKVAKYLGLGYPGGPIIDKLSKKGDAHRFSFLIPKISDGSLDFSFSGFKTAALRIIQQTEIKPRRPGGEGYENNSGNS